MLFFQIDKEKTNTTQYIEQNVYSDQIPEKKKVSQFAHLIDHVYVRIDE